jgi:hypothetical protein
MGLKKSLSTGSDNRMSAEKREAASCPKRVNVADSAANATTRAQLGILISERQWVLKVQHDAYAALNHLFS